MLITRKRKQLTVPCGYSQGFSHRSPRFFQFDPRLSVPTSSAVTTGSLTVCGDEFCNGDGEGRSLLVGNVEAAYQRGVELASQGIEPASEPAYLNNILLVAINAAVVIVGRKINYLLLLQAGQDLPDGRKTIIVGIRDFSIL